MTLFGEYLKFVTCLAVGLGGISYCMMRVIEHFFTDRGLEDYELSGRFSHAHRGPGPRPRLHENETGLTALLMRLLVRIPPPRRVEETSFTLRGKY